MTTTFDYIKANEDSSFVNSDGKKEYSTLKNGDTVYYKNNGAVDYVALKDNRNMDSRAYAAHINAQNRTKTQTVSTPSTTLRTYTSASKPAVSPTTSMTSVTTKPNTSISVSSQSQKQSAANALIANIGLAKGVLSHEDYVEALKAEKEKANAAKAAIKAQNQQIQKQKREIAKKAKEEAALIRKASGVLAAQQKTQQLMGVLEKERQKLAEVSAASNKKVTKSKQKLYEQAALVEAERQNVSDAATRRAKAEKAEAEAQNQAAKAEQQAAQELNNAKRATMKKRKEDADATAAISQDIANLQDNTSEINSQMNEDSKQIEFETRAMDAYEIHSDIQIQKMWLENREKQVKRDIVALENQKVRDENLETLLNALKFEEIELKKLELNVAKQENELSIEQQAALIEARNRELKNRQSQIDAETKLIETSSMLEAEKQAKYQELESRQQELTELEQKVQAQENQLQLQQQELEKLQAPAAVEAIETATAEGQPIETPVENENGLEDFSLEEADAASPQKKFEEYVYAVPVDESTIDPSQIAMAELAEPEDDLILGDLGEDYRWLKERLSHVQNEIAALEIFTNLNQMYNETGINGINLKDMHSTLLDEERDLESAIIRWETKDTLHVNSSNLNLLLRDVENSRKIAERNEKFFNMIDHPFIVGRVQELDEAKQIKAAEGPQLEKAHFVEAIPAEAATITEKAEPSVAKIAPENTSAPTVEAVPLPEAQPVSTATPVHPTQEDSSDDPMPTAMPVYPEEATPIDQPTIDPQDTIPTPIATPDPVPEIEPTSVVTPSEAGFDSLPNTANEPLIEEPKEEKKKKESKKDWVNHGLFFGLLSLATFLSTMPALAFMGIVAIIVAAVWGVIAVIETVIPEFSGNKKGAKKSKKEKTAEAEKTLEINNEIAKHKNHLTAIEKNYTDAENALKARIKNAQTNIETIKKEAKKAASTVSNLEKENLEIQKNLDILEKKKESGEIAGNSYELEKTTLTIKLQNNKALIDITKQNVKKIKKENAEKLEILESQIEIDQAELKRIQDEHAVKVEQEKAILSEVQLVAGERKIKISKGQTVEDFPFEDFKLEDSPTATPSTPQITSVKFGSTDKSVGRKSREV